MKKLTSSTKSSTLEHNITNIASLSAKIASPEMQYIDTAPYLAGHTALVYDAEWAIGYPMPATHPTTTKLGAGYHIREQHDPMEAERQ